MIFDRRFIARAAALMIVLAAIVDPAFTLNRRARPELVVTAASTRDSAEAERVAAALSRRFTVLRAPFANAAATVVVGDQVPDAAMIAGAGFAVTSDTAAPDLAITSMAPVAPATTHAPVQVHAVLRADRTSADVVVKLHADGVVLDSMRYRAADAHDVRAVSLTAPIATAGAHILAISAISGNIGDTARIIVDARDVRYGVLMLGGAPSWEMTFVRRSLEADPRLTVTSRTIVSRGIAATSGIASPSTIAGENDRHVIIADGAALAEGATRDELQRVARRGATVVAVGADAIRRMMPQRAAMRTITSAQPQPLTDARSDSAAMLAAAYETTTSLPAGAQPILTAKDDIAAWSFATGSGRIIAIGSSDAWRFRDPSRSRFAAFWQQTITGAAALTPRPLDVRLDQTVHAPHDDAGFVISVVDTDAADPSVVLRTRTGESAVPTARTGASEWRGLLHVPADTGVAYVLASTGALRDSTPLLITAARSGPRAVERDLLADWVRAHGGRVVSQSDLRSLPRIIDDVVRAEAQPVTSHPMRSPWWIIPLAAALALEWYWRRRRGLL